MAKKPKFKILVVVRVDGCEFTLCEPFEDHVQAESVIRHILRRSHDDDVFFAKKNEGEGEGNRVWFVRTDAIVAARNNVVAVDAGREDDVTRD